MRLKIIGWIIVLLLFVSSPALALITSGTFEIGTGGGAAYPNWEDFEAAIDSPMDEDLTGEGQNEETNITTDVAFDTDTNGFLLKLTAKSGADHDGTKDSGAQIKMADFDSFRLAGADLKNVEISKLAFDITGSNNDGIWLATVHATATVLIHRNLLLGSNITDRGISIVGIPSTLIIRNNIVTGNSTDTCIFINRTSDAGGTYDVFNNTVVGCNDGINFAVLSTNVNQVINNLVQNSNNNDYTLSNVDSNAKNISMDSTSPDGAVFQTLDMLSGNSNVFVDSGASEFQLNETANAENIYNIAKLKEGDDLEVAEGFSVDCNGDTRADWYSGADEIVAAGEAAAARPQSMINISIF